MNFSEFSQKVQKILDVDLPTGPSIEKECISVADNIKIGRTAFMDKMGVGSELEYKKQCIKDNKITFHAHIGLSSWDATADALAYLYNATRDCGNVVDRAGICLDRRMGLPKEHRDRIPAETGPMLETPDKIVLEARAKNVEAILISTHNGMALDFAKRLKNELDAHKVEIPVVLGGILNQKVEDQPLPVDVSNNIKELDFLPCPRLENKLTNLLEYKLKNKYTGVQD